jgi:hypothetical protein
VEPTLRAAMRSVGSSERSAAANRSAKLFVTTLFPAPIGPVITMSCVTFASLSPGSLADRTGSLNERTAAIGWALEALGTDSLG